ncbi:hypothetical protein [Paractinoplanes durhamensis]|uniref:Uncharacterized protein n=1 Tax=Paractinoplanes durhamensis TaxID=113563 RepID=A0ABQ3ZDB4_9ACTN|nr:hypothetical protein Adu01nite_91830 [Actinoplanes durhamensis]
MIRAGTLHRVAAAVTVALVGVGFALGGVHLANLHNGLIAASFTTVGL